MNPNPYFTLLKNILSYSINKITLLLFILGISFSSFAQPSGFQDQLKVQGSINNSLFSTVGTTFDKAGGMYGYEASGKIWAIRFNNNVEQRYLMLDINNEVFNNNDVGLVSMVLDPEFLSNGYFYIMYAVNRQFLIDGTDGGDDASQSGSIVRVTRYTANVNAQPSFSTVDVNSRLVLLGTIPSEGIPIMGINHGGGCLLFGSDGTLLVATGDGAGAGFDVGNIGYFQESLNLEIITPAQNVGNYRCQMDNSLNGKVLRINPLNGEGIPSNPHYNSIFPRSAESRMWAKGFRNPFRITLFPNTGGHHPEEGDPGIIVVGEVGSSLREEINTITAPAQNFGWPHFEGIDIENFNYDDINYIPAVNRKPIFEYRNSEASANVFLNQTTKLQLGTGVGQFSYSGSTAFVGNAIMMGEFYQGTTYPSQYQNALFFADFSAKWIKVMKFNANYEPASIEDFMQLNEFVVAPVYNPVDESMYYVTGDGLPCDQIRKLVYSPSNVPPIAKIQVDTNHGLAPLPVAFSAIKSYDPDNSPLTYEWTIDNAIYSTGLSPHLVFTPSGNTPQNFKVKLKVTDLSGTGLSSTDSVMIYANNTPPVISSTSVDAINFITPNQNYFLNLNAVVSDAQTASNDLQLSWTIAFAHNGHEHSDPPLFGNNATSTLTGVACEVGVATYWYKVYLKVTDLQGLSTTYIKEIQIDCPGNSQMLAFPTIASQEVTLNVPNNITASANSLVEATPISFFVVTGPATISGNTLTLTGKPGKVRIKATQHGNNAYKPTLPVEQTFEVDRTTVHYSINFDVIPDKRKGDAPFNISASTSPTAETPNYLVISGPASISGNTVTLTGGIGIVKIRAYYEGNYTNKGAFSDVTFKVSNNIATTDESIYGDALGVNWQNSSTISSLNISNSSPKFINSRSIKVTNPTIDEELILSYGGFPIDTTGYKDGLEFWVYNEGSTIFPLQIQLFSESSGGSSGSNLLVYADANKWTRFLFDKFIFGNLTQIGRISIKLGQSQAQSLYFDEIKLVNCANMYSIKTGNWNQANTWSCGRVPISTDAITVTAGHTVTIPNGVSATLNFLQLLGTLNVQIGGIFDIKNY